MGKGIYRVGFFILPRDSSTPPASQSWWKTEHGDVAFADAASGLYETSAASFKDYADLDLGSALRFSETSQTRIQNVAGQSWTYETQVSTASVFPASRCEAVISSPQFAGFIMQRRFELKADHCELAPIDATHFKVAVSHAFPPKSASRDYEIESIALVGALDTQRIEGAPAFVPTISVQGPPAPAPGHELGMTAFRLVTKMPGVGQWVSAPDRTDEYGIHHYQVVPGSLANLAMEIQSASPIKRESAFQILMKWQRPASSAQLQTIFSIHLESKIHDLPFNNQSQLATDATGTQFFFALQTPALSDPTQFVSYEAQTLYMINDDLEEYFTGLPMVIEAQAGGAQ
jgi:hypothetical protein